MDIESDTTTPPEKDSVATMASLLLAVKGTLAFSKEPWSHVRDAVEGYLAGDPEYTNNVGIFQSGVDLWQFGGLSVAERDAVWAYVSGGPPRALLASRPAETPSTTAPTSAPCTAVDVFDDNAHSILDILNHAMATYRGADLKVNVGCDLIAHGEETAVSDVRLRLAAALGQILATCGIAALEVSPCLPVGGAPIEWKTPVGAATLASLVLRR